MSDDPTLPFGHSTLKLRAVFVPDGAQLSMSDITRVVGFDPVMIRAVWVPEGGALPGYPYEHIGQAVFIPDSDDRATPASRNRQNSQRMKPSRAASLSALSRTDDSPAQEDNAPDSQRWSGSPLASPAGPWLPAANPTGGSGSSGGLAPRRGVRSAQANFSAAVPTPHVDVSRNAIAAAVSALALKPSDGASASKPIMRSLAHSGSTHDSGDDVHLAAADATTKDLIGDEVKGGHTIETHVGKSQEDLASRLDRESHLVAASTYRNLT